MSADVTVPMREGAPRVRWVSGMHGGTAGGPSLPTGVVTLLLGDLEGSVRLWEDHPAAMPAMVARLYELAASSVDEHRGVRPEEQGEGDSFVAAFASAADALACALRLQRAIACEPWPEDARVRMRMALHSGEAELRDESNYMGAAINRCARLRALAHGGQTLLSGAVYELVADRLPPDVVLADLGVHRLRDLSRAERVWELRHPGLDAGFDSLRSLDARPNNLPVQLTTFVGREAELAQVGSLLRGSRLCTLTGAGGCGKTRLAVQAGAEVIDGFPDGVWWVDLAPVADPELVPATVAVGAGVREVKGQEPTETLLHQLRDRRTLLLLDNCEHLVGACAALTDALLRSCPAVSVLATSREPLGLAGEAAWRVPSLGLPEHHADAECEAVRLFADRARLARPTFALTSANVAAVTDVCTRLDGIPLAIELAAARVRMLSPIQILQGLSDRFQILTGGSRIALPRQRTLEASVDWSYQLLDSAERLLLTRLSVFVGSFTLEAAEAVCADGSIDAYAVLGLLSNLVDKSLVQVDEDAAHSRYRLLETIRHYARTRLADAGDAAAVRTRHLDFYLALGERAEPELEGGGLLRWIETLELELDNIRAAMDWSADCGEPEKGWRLATALWTYWHTKHVGEGLSRTAGVLAAPDVDQALRCRALFCTGILSIFLGDLPTTAASAEEALAIARSRHDRRSEGRAINLLGWVDLFSGREECAARLQEAIEIHREVDDTWFLGRGFLGLGIGAIMVGEAQAALELSAEALRITQSDGDFWGAGLSLFYLSFVRFHAGDLPGARANAEEALDIGRRLGEVTDTAVALHVLGWLGLAAGKTDEAARLIDEALVLSREGRNPYGMAFATWVRGVLGAREGAGGRTVAELREAAEVGELVGFLWTTAWCRALAAELTGDEEEAVAAVALARASQNRWSLARALLTQARIVSADVHRAWGLAQEALAQAVDGGNTLLAIEAVETLAAWIEGPADATRLLAAAHAHRREIGYAAGRVEQATTESLLGTLRDAIGAEAFDHAWDEGSTLDFQDAVAYARRGRGARRRPTAGWPSLTPSELEVVKLVAQGLSNPEIAARLFVARSTVKEHLKHVFPKLGVRSRAELAAEAAKRGMTTAPS